LLPAAAYPEQVRLNQAGVRREVLAAIAALGSRLSALGPGRSVLSPRAESRELRAGAQRHSALEAEAGILRDGDRAARAIHGEARIPGIDGNWSSHCWAVFAASVPGATSITRWKVSRASWIRPAYRRRSAFWRRKLPHSRGACSMTALASFR